MTNAQAVAQMAAQMLREEGKLTQGQMTGGVLYLSEGTRKTFVQLAWSILDEAYRQENTVGRAVSHVDAPSAPEKEVQAAHADEPEPFAHRLEDIVDLVYFKRKEQDKQWGGPTHDASHRSDEWMKIRLKFEERLVLAMRHTDVPGARDALVDLIALGVAQLQSLMRKYPFVVDNATR